MIELELRQVEQELLVGRRRRRRRRRRSTAAEQQQHGEEDVSARISTHAEDHANTIGGESPPALDVRDDRIRVNFSSSAHHDEEAAEPACIEQEDLVLERLFATGEQDYVVDEDLPRTTSSGSILEEQTILDYYPTEWNAAVANDGRSSTSDDDDVFEDPDPFFVVGDTDEEEEYVLSRLAEEEYVTAVVVESSSKPLAFVAAARHNDDDAAAATASTTSSPDAEDDGTQQQMPVQEAPASFHQQSSNVKKRPKKKKNKKRTKSTLNKRQLPTRQLDIPEDVAVASAPVVEVDYDDDYNINEDGTIDTSSLRTTSSGFSVLVSAALRSVLKAIMVAIGLTIVLVAATVVARLTVELITESSSSARRQ